MTVQTKGTAPAYHAKTTLVVREQVSKWRFLPGKKGSWDWRSRQEREHPKRREEIRWGRGTGSEKRTAMWKRRGKWNTEKHREETGRKVCVQVERGLGLAPHSTDHVSTAVFRKSAANTMYLPGGPPGDSNGKPYFIPLQVIPLDVRLWKVWEKGLTIYCGHPAHTLEWPLLTPLPTEDAGTMSRF